MDKNNILEVSKSWETHWQNEKKPTILGRLIFARKVKALASIISNIACQTALDVGCGLGYTLAQLEKCGLKATGIDVSPFAVFTCRKKGLTAVESCVDEVVSTYDLVLSDGLLEHFLDFEPYACHLMRLSKKFVIIIQSDHETFIMKLLFLLEHVLRRGKNVYEYNFMVSDYVKVFQKNGFELLVSRSAFFSGFKLLVFKKN